MCAQLLTSFPIISTHELFFAHRRTGSSPFTGRGHSADSALADPPMYITSSMIPQRSCRAQLQGACSLLVALCETWCVCRRCSTCHCLRSCLQHTHSTAPSRPCRSYHLLALFDGHRRATAASFCAGALVGVLESHLPSFHQPAASQPATGPAQHPAAAATATSEAEEWEGHLQAALLRTVVELQQQLGSTGCGGGCTAAIVLQVMLTEG